MEGGGRCVRAGGDGRAVEGDVSDEWRECEMKCLQFDIASP